MLTPSAVEYCPALTVIVQLPALTGVTVNVAFPFVFDCVLTVAMAPAVGAHVSLSVSAAVPSSCVATNVCVLEEPMLRNDRPLIATPFAFEKEMPAGYDVAAAGGAVEMPPLQPASTHAHASEKADEILIAGSPP